MKFLLIFFTISSFLRGENSKNRYNFKNLNSIVVSGSFEINLKNSNDEFVEIIDEKNLKFVKIEIKNDVLNISNKRDFKFRDEKISLNISYKKINFIDIAGNNILKNDNSEINDSSIKIKTKGKNRVKLNTNTKNFVLYLSGFSKVELIGKVDSLDIKNSGSSQLDFSKLNSNKADVKSKGNSKITFGTIESIDGKLEGKSVLYYSGEPKINLKTKGKSFYKKLN